MGAYGLVVRAWESMTNGWQCIRYGGKKIENFYFVSFILKMILKGFWSCFGDFCFSRSPNPLHHSMCKVWAEKIENFIFVSFDLKMI